MFLMLRYVKRLTLTIVMGKSLLFHCTQRYKKNSNCNIDCLLIEE